MHPDFPTYTTSVTHEIASHRQAVSGFSVAGVVAMFLLATLDLAAAYCAVRYLRTGYWGWWSAGALGQLALWFVYVASLEYAELGTVTLGWIVIVQIGVVAMDRLANGVLLPTGKWLAMAAILVLMTYLLLAPNRVASGPH